MIASVLCVQVFGLGPMLRDRPGYQFGYVRGGERLGTSVKTDGLSVCVPLRRRLHRAGPCVSAEAERITFDPAGRRIRDPELRVVQNRGLRFPLLKPSGAPRPRRAVDPGRAQVATVFIAEPGKGDSIFPEAGEQEALVEVQRRRDKQAEHIRRRHRQPGLAAQGGADGAQPARAAPQQQVHAEQPHAEHQQPHAEQHEQAGGPAGRPQKPIQRRKAGSVTARKGDERLVRRLIRRLRRHAQRAGIPLPGEHTLEEKIANLQPSKRFYSGRRLARKLHMASRTLAISNAEWQHMSRTTRRMRWTRQRWERRLLINAEVCARHP